MFLVAAFHIQDAQQIFQRHWVQRQYRWFLMVRRLDSHKMRNTLLSHPNLFSLIKKSPLGVFRFLQLRIPDALELLCPSLKVGHDIPALWEGWSQCEISKNSWSQLKRPARPWAYHHFSKPKELKNGGEMFVFNW